MLSNNVRFIFVFGTMLSVTVALHIEEMKRYSAAEERRANETLKADMNLGFMPKQIDLKKP